MPELVANLSTIEEVAPVDDFIRLRLISGLTPRPKEAVVKGLPRSLYGVHIYLSGESEGMYIIK
ncbi:hypothetical protein [Shewanella benthica]|nr:hypothetical protein [Shewanella benthica]